MVQWYNGAKEERERENVRAGVQESVTSLRPVSHKAQETDKGEDYLK